MTNECYLSRGEDSNVFAAGQRLVWWDHNSPERWWRGGVVCPECGRPVEGTLVRKSDHDGDRAQCADCWRRDGATDR